MPIIRFIHRLYYLVEFILFYLWEIVLSSLIVAHDAMTMTHYMKPGVIGMPLSAKSELEIFIVANLITMTPGTLALDVSTDRKTLYIHCMYGLDTEEDIPKMQQRLKTRIEQKVLRLWE